MVTIVDADGHIVEPHVVWDEYTEPEYRDRVIQVRRSSEGTDEFWINGERRRGVGGSVAASMIPGGFLDPERARTATWDDILMGSWEPHERIKVMDAERIDLAVLYPSLWLVYGDFTDPRVAVAACRAYNNWLGDFCSEDPDRLKGIAMVPVQDVAAAGAELARTAEEFGFVGAFLRPNPVDGRTLSDPYYGPLYQAASELRLPVLIHEGATTVLPEVGRGRISSFGRHIVAHPLEQMLACLSFCGDGVLERFPELKVGFMESGCGWLPYWLERMDEHWEHYAFGANRPLPLPPVSTSSANASSALRETSGWSAMSSSSWVITLLLPPPTIPIPTWCTSFRSTRLATWSTAKTSPTAPRPRSSSRTRPAFTTWT